MFLRNERRRRRAEIGEESQEGGAAKAGEKLARNLTKDVVANSGRRYREKREWRLRKQRRQPLVVVGGGCEKKPRVGPKSPRARVGLIARGLAIHLDKSPVRQGGKKLVTRQIRWVG